MTILILISNSLGYLLYESLIIFHKCVLAVFPISVVATVGISAKQRESLGCCKVIIAVYPVKIREYKTGPANMA